MNMNFNPYGFIAPKTKQEYIALLDEAILMGQELNRMWETSFSYAQQEAKCVQVQTATA
ncbi:hypothetical protein LQZ44_11900 [Alcaligenes nematophilus]|uniref:hypothetical protein n=1 Tax=Alcaligenes nematophilus TaxID=2994643 RepID=UPI0035B53A18